ncbi:MAG: hypothetical protein ACK47R_04695, partial [Planctomycetia bacterium]
KAYHGSKRSFSVVAWFLDARGNTSRKTIRIHSLGLKFLEDRLNPTSIYFNGDVDIYEANNNYFYSDGQHTNAVGQLSLRLTIPWQEVA